MSVMCGHKKNHFHKHLLLIMMIAGKFINTHFFNFMVSLFQEFEFNYPNGDLFYDKSGVLSRSLRDVFPELVAKDTDINQREFSAQDFQMLFGIVLARLQTLVVDNEEFGHKAAQFLALVCDHFEIGILNGFSYKHILGTPLSTFEQANDLMWPIIGEEQKAKMASIAPLPSWKSIEGEFVQGPLTFESRIAVMNLMPAKEMKIGVHLIDKMRFIIFPTVQLQGVTLEEAIEYLSLKSCDLDIANMTSERGVRLEVERGLATAASLSLDLKDVPMLEALRMIIDLAEVKIKLTPDRVFIVHSSDTGNLPHVTYHLRVRGTQPINVAEFDPATFIRNFQEQHSKDILLKLAPHLAKK